MRGRGYHVTSRGAKPESGVRRVHRQRGRHVAFNGRVADADVGDPVPPRFECGSGQARSKGPRRRCTAAWARSPEPSEADKGIHAIAGNDALENSQPGKGPRDARAPSTGNRSAPWSKRPLDTHRRANILSDSPLIHSQSALSCQRKSGTRSWPGCWLSRGFCALDILSDLALGGHASGYDLTPFRWSRFREGDQLPPASWTAPPHPKLLLASSSPRS